MACSLPETYVVVAGDTLMSIAERNGLTLGDLLVANPQITDPSVLHVDDRITISPIDLGTLGGQITSANAMNERGGVVGRSETAAGESRAFLWQDGTMTDLGTLDGFWSEATDINNDGQVVGTSATERGLEHAFLWQDGTLTDLGGLPLCDETGCIFMSGASAINDRGLAGGWSHTNLGSQRHAALWRDNGWTDLGTLSPCSGPGCASRGHSQATALNNDGQVVGWSSTASPPTLYGRPHAFLWQDGTMTDLGAFNDDWSEATGINNEGQVIGWSRTVVAAEVDSGYEHAVLWQGGTMTDLGTLGGGTSRAYAINDRGQVVGISTTATGDERVFLWQAGAMADLAPRVADAFPIAINDCGDIVAQRDAPDGEWHAYLWRQVASTSGLPE